MKQTQAEQHHEQLDKILEKFKDQFNAELQPTGHEMTARENGGIREEEYWVKNLIDAPQGLNFKIGGWFSIDTRGEEDDNPTVYCRLSLEVNNEQVNETKMLMCRYHPEKEKWGEIRQESF